jgi:hypothetical protein
MARRTPLTVRKALVELEVATTTGRDLPIVFPGCPLCDAPISQDITGNYRPLRHFFCPACGWWLIISAAAIREAITGAADPEGDDTAGGSNGSVWFNAETGKLILIPTEWDRARRRQQSRAHPEGAQ